MSVNYEGVTLYVTEDSFTTDLAIALLAEADIIDPVSDENGNIYISEYGKIYTL